MMELEGCVFPFLVATKKKRGDVESVRGCLISFFFIFLSACS